MRRWIISLFVSVGFSAGPAFAHPHVWVDTQVEVLLNDRNEATALRLTWTYDDFYSLVVLGDLGLDPDGDGQLTPDEQAKLSGFDMKWAPDFPGGTYALQGDRPLQLSRPRDWDARYDGGRITSTHVRDIDPPVAVRDVPLIVQVYDPEYYIAFGIPFDPVLTGGTGCLAQTFVPDMDEAQQKLMDALAEYTPDMDPEASFPAVGATFAEEVRVTCAAP